MTNYTKQPDYKTKKGKVKWAVVARRDNGNVVRVWSKKKGKNPDGSNIYKFKASKTKPGDDYKWRTGKDRAKAAKAWAENYGPIVGVYGVTKERWPALQLYNDIGRWDVADSLQKVAWDLGRWIRGGWERSKRSQWELRDGYLRGAPGFALAAQCCSLSGRHDWATCQKHGPCHSNHCDRDGKGGGAIDTSVHHGNRSSSYTGIRSYPGGEKALARQNLYARVPSEDWHISRSGN